MTWGLTYFDEFILKKNVKVGPPLTKLSGSAHETALSSAEFLHGMLKNGCICHSD